MLGRMLGVRAGSRKSSWTTARYALFAYWDMTCSWKGRGENPAAINFTVIASERGKR